MSDRLEIIIYSLYSLHIYIFIHISCTYVYLYLQLSIYLYHFRYINMCVFIYFQTYIYSKYFFSNTLIIHVRLFSKKKTRTLRYNIYFQKLPREVDSLLIVRFSVSCVGGLGLGGQHTVGQPFPYHFRRVRGGGFKAHAGCAISQGGPEHPWIWASLGVWKQSLRTLRHIWSQESSGIALESDSCGLCPGSRRQHGCALFGMQTPQHLEQSAEPAGTLRTGHWP